MSLEFSLKQLSTRNVSMFWFQYFSIFFWTFFSFSDDHSRVVLNTVEDLEGSDYVNANYIDVSEHLFSLLMLHLLFGLTAYLSFVGIWSWFFSIIGIQ